VEEQESNTKPFVNIRKAARITTAPKRLSYPWGVLQYILPQSIIFPFKESETGGELRQLPVSIIGINKVDVVAIVVLPVSHFVKVVVGGKGDGTGGETLWRLRHLRFISGALAYYH